jgi:uncharacterized protein YacL
MLIGSKLTLFLMETLEPTFFQSGNLIGVKWVVAIFGTVMTLPLALLFQIFYQKIKEKFIKSSTEVFIFRSFSIVAALIIAQLCFGPIYLIFSSEEFFPNKQFVTTFINVLFLSFGIMIADIHYRYFSTIVTPNFLQGILMYEKFSKFTTTKVIDTNILINHNLDELLQTGFIEGTIIIPKTVFKNLYDFKTHLSDKVKKRGTKGLLILNKLKKFNNNQIFVDFFLEDIVTSNKVCLFLQSNEKTDLLLHDNDHLNSVLFNQLIKATRIPYLYGEIFSIQVLRKGNRLGQGIGYLDDGTMVIIEKGYPFIGQKITVSLKKVWQRSSGTILFTTPQNLMNTNRIRKRKEQSRKNH